MTAPGVDLVPVHVGQPQPGAAPAHRRAQRERRAALLAPGVDWPRHGLEPRWLGMESSDCAAALEPSTFSGHGATELERFLAGARGRGETALVIATIGDVADESPRSVLSTYDASLSLPGMRSSIDGSRLPAGTRPTLAGDLDPADRDLGRRLLARSADAPWWRLRLAGLTWLPGAGGPPTNHPPEGQLCPILVDGLGDPVVAAWSPSAEDQRWYVVPDATDWNWLLDWLVRQALPAHVPGALRRARSPHFVDPDLQTRAESTARRALADLEARYAEEKADLEADLQLAVSAADPIRYGLLYGTGAELVAAVDAVLTTAGFATVNLDTELGGTKSADLLATLSGHSRLIEVKSASGGPSESLVGDLQRHLATWRQLRPQQPVGGGVLVVNHQHRLLPHQRSLQVYSRREFVDSLTVEVIGTRALFEWWRASDWASVRAAVLGSIPAAADPPAPPSLASSTPPPERRLRWRWRGGTR